MCYFCEKLTNQKITHNRVVGCDTDISTGQIPLKLKQSVVVIEGNI